MFLVPHDLLLHIGVGDCQMDARHLAKMMLTIRNIDDVRKMYTRTVVVLVRQRIVRREEDPFWILWYTFSFSR